MILLLYMFIHPGWVGAGSLWGGWVDGGMGGWVGWMAGWIAEWVRGWVAGWLVVGGW